MADTGNNTIHSCRRRKYKIVKPLRFFTFVLICIITLVFIVYGILGSSRVQAASQTRYTEVKIQENDTLWNIVDTYNPDANIDIRMALYDVYEINGIDDAGSIKPGDIIRIPIY